MLGGRPARRDRFRGGCAKVLPFVALRCVDPQLAHGLAVDGAGRLSAIVDQRQIDRELAVAPGICGPVQRWIDDHGVRIRWDVARAIDSSAMTGRLAVFNRERCEDRCRRFHGAVTA